MSDHSQRSSSSYMNRNSSTQRQTEIVDIVAIEDPEEHLLPSNGKFKGKRKVWPGAIALILLISGAIFCLTYYGMKLHDKVEDTKASDKALRQGKAASGKAIRDGTDRPINRNEDRNPTEYADQKCIQPNYIAKDNLIYAEADGKSQAIPIKGINWLGMETEDAVPFGIWDDAKSGTTLFEIVDFLAYHKFNVVRLPLAVDSIARNIIPNRDLINTYSNTAIDPSRYINLIKSVVKGLAYRNIGVILDFHNLAAKEPGELWFGSSVRDDEYTKAIKTLAEELCNSRHWNVMGIDLKNAPTKATWGDESETDWHVAATKYGNMVIEECPKWLVMVQGISEKRRISIDGEIQNYRDWDGSGLEEAAKKPIELKTTNKVVYAPQYYNPSKSPHQYFYADKEFTELSDEKLKENVITTMDAMFGGVKKESTVVFSQFGGIYGDFDEHKKKTNKRVMDIIIDIIMDSKQKIGGGFLFSLNPSTSWSYNPTDKAISMEYGLMESNWLDVNTDLLEALNKLNKMDDIKLLTCRK